MLDVKVKIISYSNIINTYQTIEIPDYQRPYRWDKDKINDLLTDLQQFFLEKKTANISYYMGGILLYNNKKKNCFQIIDGQQRLTTLNLIYYILNGQILPGQNFNYNNHLSIKHIKENVEYLKSKGELLERLQLQQVFEKLEFTLIESCNEDQSFTFFDSQNNRGVGLSAEDYLKAYHLREVSSENSQSMLAQQWEKAAIKAQNDMNAEKGLLHLFYKILYRSREWKGQNHIVPESKDTILKSFQKKTLKAANDSYLLFRGNDNVRYHKMVVMDNEKIVPLSMDERNFVELSFPFSIRQPLYKGLNFFQFTQKYYAIHQLLFHSRNEMDIENARIYYNHIYTDNMSEYLRHYMQLCMVMYFDNFGSHELEKAVQYFDYFIGSIRIDKYYVRQESVKNSLIHSKNNLLDVIAHSYLPDEIFQFIESLQSINEIYDKEVLRADDGVRNNYKRRVMTFYCKNDKTLKKRLEWIN